MKPLSIVIADDLKEIQHLVAQWLGHLGHSVETASSGRELVQLLSRRSYDVVITDMLMPDGDGVEVLTAMKKARHPARVLAISGGGTYLRAYDVLNVARGFGAHGVLMKPFNCQQLIEAIAQLMQEQPAPAPEPASETHAAPAAV